MSFEDFISSIDPPVADLTRLIRILIMDVLPGLIEQVDPPSKIVAYGTGRTYSGLICAIAPHRFHVNLMFSRGVDLPDPTGLLEGTGKRARHVKIKRPEDIAQPAVQELLRAAGELAKK